MMILHVDNPSFGAPTQKKKICFFNTSTSIKNLVMIDDSRGDVRGLNCRSQKLYKHSKNGENYVVENSENGGRGKS